MSGSTVWLRFAKILKRHQLLDELMWFQTELRREMLDNDRRLDVNEPSAAARLRLQQESTVQSAAVALPAQVAGVLRDGRVRGGAAWK